MNHFNLVTQSCAFFFQFKTTSILHHMSRVIILHLQWHRFEKCPKTNSILTSITFPPMGGWKRLMGCHSNGADDDRLSCWGVDMVRE